MIPGNGTQPAWGWMYIEEIWRDSMNDEWWERPACVVCDYGWILLVILVLATVAFFTRDYWMPLLGL